MERGLEWRSLAQERRDPLPWNGIPPITRAAHSIVNSPYSNAKLSHLNMATESFVEVETKERLRKGNPPGP
ncbi:hypothetical protein NDU88_000950 [Pleurodeles waltl]|uniref:Uncharacterized protein n=1 Tax=Pleurodeles waltl TaxID=8319 RepID=A0AAV7KNZ9_PLEWA|nr:hypothetical protein NDU88_000950 [Pleurodeles waltl]